MYVYIIAAHSARVFVMYHLPSAPLPITECCVLRHDVFHTSFCGAIICPLATLFYALGSLRHKSIKS